nr:hypothetical protein [Tanacetum cinerariifolium]
MPKNTIVLLLHLIRGRREEERINHLKQDQEICRGKRDDVGLDELGEGGKGVVSKIGEFGGDLGSKLLGDRGLVL